VFAKAATESPHGAAVLAWHDAPWLVAAAVFFAAAFVSSNATAAKVMAVNGQAQVIRSQQLSPVLVGAQLLEQDALLLAPNAEVLVQFDDGAKMVVRGDSQLLFRKLVEAGEADLRQKTLQIIKGGLRYLSGALTLRKKVAFETPSSTVGIRGTDLEIAVSELPLDGNPAGTYLKVNVGQAVLAGLDGAEVELASGQVAFGAEPQPTAAGTRAIARPSTARLALIPLSVFKSAQLDSLLN
jgi:hypothetical protein